LSALVGESPPKRERTEAGPIDSRFERTELKAFMMRHCAFGGRGYPRIRYWTTYLVFEAHIVERQALVVQHGGFQDATNALLDVTDDEHEELVDEVAELSL
jgi:hypothetical protein